jgi:hypothetical protein
LIIAKQVQNKTREKLIQNLILNGIDPHEFLSEICGKDYANQLISDFSNSWNKMFGHRYELKGTDNALISFEKCIEIYKNYKCKAALHEEERTDKESP